MADNNTLLEKLEGLVARFEEVSTLITDPNVIADQKRYVKLTKEYKDMSDIMKARKEYIQCLNGLDVGQEMVFAAEIIAGSDSAIGTPMTYDFYRSEMHGLSPVGSPTYVPPESTFDKSSGESFVCSVCGYVYSDPNFSFEELPDNWVCPVCKMPKKAFVRRN